MNPKSITVHVVALLSLMTLDAMRYVLYVVGRMTQFSLAILNMKEGQIR